MKRVDDDETVRAVVDLRMTEGSATYGAVADRLGISKTAAVARVRRLVSTGRLRGSGRAGSLLPHHGELMAWVLEAAAGVRPMCCDHCRQLVLDATKKRAIATAARTAFTA